MTRTLLVAAVSMVIAGCGSPPTPRFYTLSTQASANIAPAATVDRLREKFGRSAIIPGRLARRD